MSRQILELVGKGKTQTDVVKVLGCSKSTVSYHVDRFQQLEFLDLSFQDVRKHYRLTSLGSKALTRSDNLDKFLVILKDYPFKFSIIEEEKSLIDWHKLRARMIRSWGYDPEKILVKDALAAPHRTVCEKPIIPEENEINVLSNALKQMMKKEILNSINPKTT